MNTKKKIITIIIGVEVVIIAAVIIVLFYINSDSAKVSRQLELAQRYLLEEDYEQAIAAFGVVIDTDPRNEAAYLGLAEAYAAVDDLEKAVMVLEKASRKIDSEEVLAQLEIHTAEIGQREQTAQRAAEVAQVAALAASVSSEEAVTASQQEGAAVEAILTGFIVRDNDWYYYDVTGNLVTGWFETNGSRYCARADGKLYKDGGYEIDGIKYQFDPWGVCFGEVEDERELFRKYLTEVLIPDNGIFVSSQSGTMHSPEDEWLKPDGIMDATLLDFDMDGKTEMLVCCTEQTDIRIDDRGNLLSNVNDITHIFEFRSKVTSSDYDFNSYYYGIFGYEALLTSTALHK